MSELKKLGINDLLPSGRGSITVVSEESPEESKHRIAQEARDLEQKRKHDGLDKDQSRRHSEVDYWTVRGVLLVVVLVAVWILNKDGAGEPALRFAWGLIGSVVGAVLGMLKSSNTKK